MMQRSFYIVSALLCFWLIGCQTIELPSNAQITTGDRPYLDRVTFTYKSNADFSKRKVCVADNIQNRSVRLQDSSLMVGTRGITRQSIEPGGEFFKLIDEKSETLIATGVENFTLRLLSSFAKFDLKSASSNGSTTLVFSNITWAQQSTGYLMNDGFNPASALPGGPAAEIYETLSKVSDKIKSCEQQ
jgi:hypothetical protein